MQRVVDLTYDIALAVALCAAALGLGMLPAAGTSGPGLGSAERDGVVDA